jgi:hypothetical protein
MPASSELLHLAEKQVNYPAAAHVLAAGSAMLKDVGVIAAGFFERVGEDRQLGESAIAVNGFRDFRDRIIVPNQPGFLDFCNVKGVAEQTTQSVTLSPTLLFSLVEINKRRHPAHLRLRWRCRLALRNVQLLHKPSIFSTGSPFDSPGTPLWHHLLRARLAPPLDEPPLIHRQSPSRQQISQRRRRHDGPGCHVDVSKFAGNTLPQTNDACEISFGAEGDKASDWDPSISTIPLPSRSTSLFPCQRLNDLDHESAAPYFSPKPLSHNDLGADHFSRSLSFFN